MSDPSRTPSMTRVRRCLSRVRIGSESSQGTAPEPAGGRTRRGLLAGAAGAVGLLAGETILSATPAQAGTDGDAAAGTVTISLNQAPGAGLTAQVAWFVVN